MSLSKKEAMERMCRLMEEVNSAVFRFSVPSDCFCQNPESESGPCGSYQNDGKVIEFIEKAVRAAIEDEDSRSKGF